jgi:GNAT superfamily N-acetyltransferase
MHRLDAAPLFTAGSFRCFEMGAEDVSRLQKFFELNPEYHLAVGGEAPKPTEAQEEFESLPPAGWTFEKRWMLGFVGSDDAMVGMANVISDLFAEGFWHIGLFVVATSLHGGGAAHAIYSHLESWMRGRGARWLRLGVVEGNLRAERFWEKVGYMDIRKRCGVEMGKRINTLRVMAKPLANGSLSDYLDVVVRDRPESP